MFSCELLQQSDWIHIENAYFQVETFNLPSNERHK